MSGDTSTPSRTQSLMAPVPNKSTSPQPPNYPTPVRETEVNRYMPDNVFARIAYGPSDSAGAIHERLDRLGNEVDRLVDIIFTGAAIPATNAATNPGTVADLATIMGLAAGTDQAAVKDSDTATNSATGTGRASSTVTSAVSDSTIDTEQVTNL